MCSCASVTEIAIASVVDAADDVLCESGIVTVGGDGCMVVDMVNKMKVNGQAHNFNASQAMRAGVTVDVLLR